MVLFCSFARILHDYSKIKRGRNKSICGPDLSLHYFRAVNTTLTCYHLLSWYGELVSKQFPYFFFLTDPADTKY